MTIDIPIWLLWILGGAAGVLVLFLAVIGAMFWWGFRGGIRW